MPQVATLIFSDAGRGKDLDIDTCGQPVYLEADRKSTRSARIGIAEVNRVDEVKRKSAPAVFKKIEIDEITTYNAIDLKEGHLFIHPQCYPHREGEKMYREVYYISGPSSCGKSSWIAKLLRLWIAARQKLKQKTDIYLFSRVEHDNAFKGIPIHQIRLDDDLLNSPIDVHRELRDCMVIWDDIDSIMNKELREYLWELRDDVLSTGAHCGTYSINTSHDLCNWRSTRTSLKEAHYVTVFPQSERFKIRDWLEKKVGLERDYREVILTEAPKTSRWVTVSMRYPQFIACETFIRMVLPGE